LTSWYWKMFCCSKFYLLKTIYSVRLRSIYGTMARTNSTCI
jgi:hypothetical protein